MKQAIIRVDDIDKHEVDCECGLCNKNGKSFGASIYIVPNEVDISTEEKLDYFLSAAEVHNKAFGATEDAAMKMAVALCSYEGITVIQETGVAEKLYGIAVVSRINFKIDNNELLAFEFDTNEDIYVEEPDESFSLFRLQYYKKDGTIEVYVANSEDYDLHEEVTHLFESEPLYAYFRGLDDAGLIKKDYTKGYEEFYQEN